LKNTIEEIKNWLEDDEFSDKEKIENIASMLFTELSDNKKLELFDECGDDFEFYIKAIKNIDFDVYDGDCIRDMSELINNKFISMRTYPSDKMIQQFKYILS